MQGGDGESVSLYNAWSEETSLRRLSAAGPSHEKEQPCEPLRDSMQVEEKACMQTLTQV